MAPVGTCLFSFVNGSLVEVTICGSTPVHKPSVVIVHKVSDSLMAIAWKVRGFDVLGCDNCLILLMVNFL